MFKFAGGWMHVWLMKFYPAATRSDRKPYHYEAMFMDATKEKIDIQFDMSKYNREVDAPISSWCIIFEN